MSKRKKMLFGFLAIALVIGLVAGGIITYDKHKRGTNGEYDYSYNLVDLTGSEPASLTGRTRIVQLEVYSQDGELVFASSSLGYVYSEDYVVVSSFLFYVMTDYGFPLSVLEVPDISLKTFLLPDPEEEDYWKKEALGEVNFVDEKLGVVVIERVEPIIDVSQTQYKLGEYEDLAVGNKLYRVSVDVMGRLTVSPATIVGLCNSGGLNLIDFEGYILPSDLGGLFFAIRDGQFELVGLLCVMEATSSGQVGVKALDINQIIDSLKENTK